MVEHNRNIGAAMAARRSRRLDIPTDPAATIRALRACRDAMIEVCRCVKPMDPVYHGASMVILAIDALATLLTGERYYFSDDGSSASEGHREKLQEMQARERGENPWLR